MKILIATGGTGGHIFPALALADELMNEDAMHQIVFVGTNYRMEKNIIPENGYRFIGLDLSSTAGNYLNKIKALGKQIQAYHQCLKIIKQEQADICIGFGNYISIPLLLAAHRLKVKTMLHEQNSYAGKANIFLAKYVDECVGCYQANLQQLKKCPKVKIYGNPRATSASKITKDPEVLKKLGLKADLKTVLIVMGSLGSDSVNHVLKKTFELLDTSSYQVLFVVGKNTSQSYLESLKTIPNIVVTNFIKGLDVMANVDLIITRAGATTLSEIAALKLPAIIIPSPFVPNNHQLLNAQVLEKGQAAIVIEEKNLTSIKLAETINTTINNPDLLLEMAKNMQKHANSQASYDIIKDIKELVGV